MPLEINYYPIVRRNTVVERSFFPRGHPASWKRKQLPNEPGQRRGRQVPPGAMRCETACYSTNLSLSLATSVSPIVAFLPAYLSYPLLFFICTYLSWKEISFPFGIFFLVLFFPAVISLYGYVGLWQCATIWKSTNPQKLCLGHWWLSVLIAQPPDSESPSQSGREVASLTCGWSRGNSGKE